MKMFIATGIFHPESGGPATYLNGVLPEFQAAGHEVRLLTFGDPTPDDGSYGYPVQRIPRRSLVARPLAYAAYQRATTPYLTWADLAYVHSAGLPLRKSPPIPRVLKVVGDVAWERCIRRGLIPPTEDIDTFQTRRYGPLVNQIKARRAADVATMDHVIVPSNYLKQMVVGWGLPDERVHVVYNSLSPGAVALRSALSQQEARAACDLPADVPIILTVARLTAWKGIGPLIRALVQIPAARLIVAGDGPLRDELAQIAAASGVQERVTFLGYVPRERVAVLMRAADYVALYSGYEGLSHTLLESLHAGTPIITSDKGGNPEVALPGVNGFVVPYNNDAALAATLTEALQPGVRDRLAAGTPEQMDRFTWARMVGDTLAVLEGLAGC